MMAWGITIHKSQGLTLEKVVVELGEKDFSAGLSFVAYPLWQFLELKLCKV
jgi:ATP-dependent exoDNAse (exonuclease V) alpha subunit